MDVLIVRLRSSGFAVADPGGGGNPAMPPWGPWPDWLLSNCKLTLLTSFFCCDHHNNKRQLRFNTVFLWLTPTFLPDTFWLQGCGRWVHALYLSTFQLYFHGFRLLSGWYLPGGGHVLVTEFLGMTLNDLFCAQVLRPLDLVPLNDFTYKFHPGCYNLL